jgi:hypothetical protein
MFMRRITTLYDNYDDAVKTVEDLEAEGVSRGDVSVAPNNAENRYQATHDTATAGAVTGAAATVGGVLGGSAGLLAGLGVLAIPGIGPVVAAGWLAATAVGAAAGASVGAATGGLVGSLAAATMVDAHPNVLAENAHRRGTLVTARVDDGGTALVESIMVRHHPADPDAPADTHREIDWTSFDESATPYTPEEMAMDRARYLGTPPV